MNTVREEILKSGLRVVSYPISGMESVSVGIWVNAGCRYEEKPVNGISHLIEHLLFKGTATRDAEALKQEIEGNGGMFNGFTTEEHTCYLVKILSHHLESAVDVLSDMVLHPLLKQKDIEKERQVIIEEINMYKDLPNHYIHELLAETLWPDQPLGAPLAGSVESVRSIQRKGIVAYKDSYYALDNMLLIGVGKVDHAKLVQMANTYFRKGARIYKKPGFQRAVKNQKHPILNVHYKKTEQTHIAIGLHAFDRFHVDRYALSLLNIILGANMSSRLFREVRERLALCYEIASSVRRYDDTGSFIIHAGVDYEKIEKALRVIFRELRTVQRSLVGKEELRRAKEYFKGQLLLNLEDTMSCMLWLGEKIISGEKDRIPRAIIRKVDGITPDSLKRIAAEIFRDENLNMAVIGPIKREGRIKKELHIS